MVSDKILLDSIYYNVNNPACYAGIQAVHREAKKRNPAIRLSDVRNYLHSQHTYTVHKPVRWHFKRNRIKAIGVDTNWQSDLCDMQRLAKFNDGYKYLLVCIDVFSRFAWVEPIKNKQAATVAKAFVRVLKRDDRKPWWLLTDKGREYTGSDFQDLMHLKMIDHRTTESPDIKAAVAERYNRTLKTRLWKHFTAVGTNRYLNILQALVHSINSSHNETIGCCPIDVTLKNEDLIRQRMRKDEKKPVVFQFKVGDRVRIAREKTTFKKGYLPNFTEEVFVVTQCVPRRPYPVYRIRDLHGEDIKGVYYSAELVQAIDSHGIKRRVGRSVARQ